RVSPSTRPVVLVVGGGVAMGEVMAGPVLSLLWRRMCPTVLSEGPRVATPINDGGAAFRASQFTNRPPDYGMVSPSGRPLVCYLAGLVLGGGGSVAQRADMALIAGVVGEHEHEAGVPRLGYSALNCQHMPRFEALQRLGLLPDACADSGEIAEGDVQVRDRRVPLVEVRAALLSDRAGRDSEDG